MELGCPEIAEVAATAYGSYGRKLPANSASPTSEQGRRGATQLARCDGLDDAVRSAAKLVIAMALAVGDCGHGMAVRAGYAQ